MNAASRAVFVERISITTRLRGLADALASMGIQDLGICIEAAADIDRLARSNLRLRGLIDRGTPPQRAGIISRGARRSA